MSYDTRAFGDFGWEFVNAGEEYRKLINVPEEERLTMLGLFKQATIGDCNVDETRKQKTENLNRKAWLEFKGMDNIEAMQKYIDNVKRLAEIYPTKEEAESTQE